jgi:aspartyl-tRNA(Asn)/glutamyl-tRNA(Gln) amidotransferase subunit B
VGGGGVGSDAAPADIAEAEGLIQTSDSAAIEPIVDEVIAANAQAVADVTGGGKKQKAALGFLTGQVMKASRGAANPKVVQDLLRNKLGV